MKLRCPRCQSKIAVPDDWVGRTIRCKGCNKAFTVPRPTRTIVPTKTDAGLDLEGLAALERGAEEIDAKVAAEAERELREVRARSGEIQTGVRTCPFCGKRVEAPDPTLDVLCSGCWQTIPAATRAVKPKSDREARLREQASGSFYGTIATVFTYPFGAVGSLLSGAIVSIAIILLPVALLVGLARTVEQGRTGLPGGGGPEYLEGIRNGVTAFFYLEILFFAAVGVHAFLDVIRTTAVGQEKPPGLVWNPSQWGSSILAYLSLLAYYGLCAVIVLWLSGRGQFAIPTTVAEFRALLTPTVIVVAAIFTFFVPMNLIGMSVFTIPRGLNPMNVANSILRTHVHYVFLVLLVLTCLTIYVIAFVSVLAWFGGVVRATSAAAGAGDLVELAAGLLSWGLVMAFGVYGVYALGRMLGLFARSYRRDLMFE
ncbi:MAG: zinc-ribbon domain-containing protein [Phycisphaerae bacterium]|nr:zinc-ribbon domain-containing protein [Phycisphaerae bacterium]